MATPVVVEFGKKEIISTHKFNIGLVADKIARDGIDKWLTIQELAKFAYGNARQCNIKIVRQRFHAVRTVLLGKGHLLIKEPGPKPWLSCKVYVGNSEIEDQAANEYFSETAKRLSHERYERAMKIFQDTNRVREMEKAS